MELSLNMPGPELVVLPLEVENYAQNKGKIYLKNKVKLEFSKFLCESYTSRSFCTSNVFLNIFHRNEIMCFSLV